jgi:glycosyltransferase involved in cell wall biosynthesis
MQDSVNKNRHPLVSVIIPCLNEKQTIGLLLDALEKQAYPQDRIEILIADGMSTDGTRDIIQTYIQEHSKMRIRMVDNPQKSIPAGLNRGIRAATGDYIVRMDAHSLPDTAYIVNCAHALDANLGENVGGVWEIRAGDEGIWAASIATAASHPFAVGDARYRYTAHAGYVDTVPFGAFKASLIEQIGYFDESLLSNEDYEFNTRIRKMGGRVWLDPEIRSIYFARSSLRELAKQYWRYGYWKVRMLRRYPGSLRLRQAIPPLFVLTTIVLGIMAVFNPLIGLLFVAIIFLYLIFLFLTGLSLALKKRKTGLLLGVPAAMATMHLSWGSAFLWSIVTLLFSTTGHE